jgi:FAD/FMN-containing dehydrogenase
MSGLLGPSAPNEDHDAKVQAVVRQLRARASGAQVSLRKRTVSHQVPKPLDLRRRDQKIDVGSLDQILEVDPVALVCTAEPGATFQEVVRATLAHGLVPIIVPEFRQITVGGAVAGCSIESMSFRHGGFHDTCLEYELITAEGEVLRCTPDNEHQLLFQMLHGSFGTLGILSRLKFKLVPAKSHVHVEHRRYGGLEELDAAIASHAADTSLDYLDGVIYGPRNQVLTLGRFVDAAPYSSRYHWMKDYPSSVRQREEDYLSTTDYLFRYYRGITHVQPQNPVARALFGRVIDSDSKLRLAERFYRLLPEQGVDVTVDLFLPRSRLRDFLEWYDRTIGFYPLWCVPYRRVHDYEWLTPDYYASFSDDMFVDIAIYGAQNPPGRNLYKEIEDALPRFNGIKTLISFNYYDEETFWRTWNRPNYEAAKRRTDPRNLFRDLYQKTCRAVRGLAQ